MNEDIFEWASQFVDYEAEAEREAAMERLSQHEASMVMPFDGTRTTPYGEDSEHSFFRDLVHVQ